MSAMIWMAAQVLAFNSPMQLGGASNFYLHVGPGLTATVRATNLHISCSDNADCRFAVPANTRFDVLATGRSAASLIWSGCSAQPVANRCPVTVGHEPVTITVR